MIASDVWQDTFVISTHSTSVTDGWPIDRQNCRLRSSMYHRAASVMADAGKRKRKHKTRVRTVIDRVCYWCSGTASSFGVGSWEYNIIVNFVNVPSWRSTWPAHPSLRSRTLSQWHWYRTSWASCLFNFDTIILPPNSQDFTQTSYSWNTFSLSQTARGSVQHSVPCNGLSTLETIVADFGDNLSPKRRSPVLATVAELGDYSRQCGQTIRQLARSMFETASYTALPLGQYCGIFLRMTWMCHDNGGVLYLYLPLYLSVSSVVTLTTPSYIIVTKSA